MPAAHRILLAGAVLGPMGPALLPGPMTLRAAEPHVMGFMDVITLRSAREGVLSRDGSRVLFLLSVPDWKSGKAHTDIWMAPADGSAPARPMTRTRDKNENEPRWAPDGHSFGFLSDREGSRQLYLMPIDGGEARKLTDAKGGVHAYAFSPDGRHVAYLAGKAEERHLWVLALQDPEAAPRELASGPEPVRELAWAPDGTRVFYIRAEQADPQEQRRQELHFDVKIGDPERAADHIWSVGPDGKEPRRWTEGVNLRVHSFKLSEKSPWLAFRARPAGRHATDASEREASLHLLDLEKGTVRTVLTGTAGDFDFSPDGASLAYTGAAGLRVLGTRKLFVCPVAGGAPRQLLPDWDLSVESFAWSEDSRRLYFPAAQGLDMNFQAVDLEGPAQASPRPLTRERGVLSGEYDPQARRFLFTFSDPEHPADYFAATLETLGRKEGWARLSDANPQARDFRLGAVEAVRWKAPDGTQVEGLLYKPVDWKPGRPAPLIVQLHGGPAAADMNRFNGRYVTYPHVFTGAGYAVFQPNYRGSDNYGERFRTRIAGDFLEISYRDILAGVDHLVKAGVADPDRMGMMGWSAGGHLSNWTLTHTDRFKAISTGAGAANFISFYAQSDVQQVREFYLGGTPYEAWDAWVKVSPLKHIRQAKTPTLIHVGEADRRVPKPQADELFMALKKQGVPVEYIAYPGQPHGLQELRYQMVKMVSEFGWFERWIRGKESWMDWKALMDTVSSEGKGKGKGAKEGREAKEPADTAWD